MAKALLSPGDEPIINLADHDRSGLQFAAGRSEVRAFGDISYTRYASG